MRLGFEAELLKLKNKIQVVEINLEADIVETRKAKEERNLSQIDAESDRDELKKGEKFFQETFLI